MGAYTHINLAEVDDQAVNFGLSPNLELRMARVPLELEQSGISLLRVAPNFRIPFGHRHNQQEEVYVLVDGSARIKLDDEVRELRPWDAVRVGNDTMRGLEAGADGATLIAVGAPNTGPGDADIHQGWWNGD
jgi:mannose-6-phosphate isomerase-like protein (cupin superfamily)